MKLIYKKKTSYKKKLIMKNKERKKENLPHASWGVSAPCAKEGEWGVLVPACVFVCLRPSHPSSAIVTPHVAPPLQRHPVSTLRAVAHSGSGGCSLLVRHVPLVRHRCRRFLSCRIPPVHRPCGIRCHPHGRTLLLIHQSVPKYFC